MALSLLRVYTPEEAEALVQRSFGQFQKRLAASQTDERLVNVREQLTDIKRMWDDPDVSLEDVAQYFKLEERRRAIRIELKRLRREGGSQRGARRGRRMRGMGGPSGAPGRLEKQEKGLLERRARVRPGRSPG